VGAMTNESGRTLSIPLSFLNKGKYRVNIWQDGKTISTLNKTESVQTNADSLTLTLAPSGGAAVVLKKQ